MHLRDITYIYTHRRSEIFVRYVTIICFECTWMTLYIFLTHFFDLDFNKHGGAR
jgi:hypothetical protein